MEYYNMKTHQLRAKHDSKLYPIRRYYDYSFKEAVKLYRKEFELVGKHNVKFTKW